MVRPRRELLHGMSVSCWLQEHNQAACVLCRSTYNFKPPFKVYTVVEEDPHSAMKVTHPLSFMQPVAVLHFRKLTKLHPQSGCHVQLQMQVGNPMGHMHWLRKVSGKTGQIVSSCCRAVVVLLSPLPS